MLKALESIDFSNANCLRGAAAEGLAEAMEVSGRASSLYSNLLL